MKYWKMISSISGNTKIIGYMESETDPSNGWNHWIEGTKEEYDLYHFMKQVLEKADKGQLMDDIAIWHNVFSETLIKAIIFKYSLDVGHRVRLKVISDVIAKYNLDLVIKDFKPDYVIPEKDKGKLIEGLKEVEAYDDGIYQRLAQAVGLEASAMHNEVIDKYEEIINLIHPKQQIDGQTLASEIPVAGGGTQT